MKLFITKLLLGVVLLIIISSVIIIFMPYSKEFGYHSLSGAYTKGGWIYNKLYNNSGSIDIAFLGTSHTLNGVQDSLIQTRLKEDFNKQLNVTNLGIPHEGRNLHYTFTKDLLLNKAPSLILFEVREREATYSHFAFPYVADGIDIVFPKSMFNKSVWKDWFNAIKTRLDYFIDKQILNTVTTYNYSGKNSQFGYRPNQEKISYEELERRRNFYQNRNEFLENRFISKIAYQFNRSYLKSIFKHIPDDCRIVFLYIPNYHTNKERPYYYDFYKTYGDVWIPPDSLINDKDNFANYAHFNNSGAIKFSNWVTQKISEMEN